MKTSIIVKLIFIFSFLPSAWSADYIGLDVRSNRELIVNPAPGAIHISMKELDPNSIKALPKDKLIKIFCESGGRASRALKFLKTQGYSKLKNIGSWREWNQLKNSK